MYQVLYSYLPGYTTIFVRELKFWFAWCVVSFRPPVHEAWCRESGKEHHKGRLRLHSRNTVKHGSLCCSPSIEARMARRTTTQLLCLWLVYHIDVGVSTGFYWDYGS